jgi:hypothetical protein
MSALGREIGQFEHDLEPAELIGFEIVNQYARGRR